MIEGAKWLTKFDVLLIHFSCKSTMLSISRDMTLLKRRFGLEMFSIIYNKGLAGDSKTNSKNKRTDLHHFIFEGRRLSPIHVKNAFV